MKFLYPERIFSREKCLFFRTFSILFFIFYFVPAIFAAEIFIPAHLAKVRDRAEGKTGKTVVIVEEAHVDYGAQKALANIVKDLIEYESFRYVFVEGGWGDVSLTSFRNLAGLERRKEVAEKYLKEGKISGEEYINLATDLAMRIWGVEDPKLYEANMKVFLELSPVRPKLLAELKQFDAQIQSLESKLFSPSMIEIVTKRRDFEAQKTPLLDYIQFLKNRFGGAFQSFPNLTRLVALSGQDGTYDPDKVTLEKESLIRFLSKYLTKPELDEVLLLKDQKTTEDELYFLGVLFKQVKNLSKSNPPKVKTLFRYKKILNEIVRMDMTAIFPELEKASQEAFLKENPTAAQRALMEVIRGAATLGKLFDLRLTEAEFLKISASRSEIAAGTNRPRNDVIAHLPFFKDKNGKYSAGFRYKKLNESRARKPEADEAISNFNLETWNSFLKGTCEKHGVPFQPVDAKELTKWIPAAMSFYQTACAREKAMIENFTYEMKNRNLKRALLVAGGFHSRNIYEAIKKEGHSVILVSPRFAPSTDSDLHERYLQILKDKWIGKEIPNSNIRDSNSKLAVDSSKMIKNT